MPRLFDALARLMPGGLMPFAVGRVRNAEEKASRTGPLIALQTLGRPVWTPRDYAAFAREGYMQNAICYRAVRMIAEAAASVPLLALRGRRGDRGASAARSSSGGRARTTPALTSSRPGTDSCSSPVMLTWRR